MRKVAKAVAYLFAAAKILLWFAGVIVTINLAIRIIGGFDKIQASYENHQKVVEEIRRNPR